MMAESIPLFKPKISDFVSQTVAVGSPIEIETLCRLLREYSIRLISKCRLLAKDERPIGVSNLSEQNSILRELKNDVGYLGDQTHTLVEIASAYLEQNKVTVAEQFELKLYIFDAEDALRTAQRLLNK